MYGLSCGLNSGGNIFALPPSVADPCNPNGLKSDPDFLDSSVILYAAGSTGIVHDLSTNTQAQNTVPVTISTCIQLTSTFAGQVRVIDDYEKSCLGS